VVTPRIRFPKASNPPDWVQFNRPDGTPFSLRSDHVAAFVEQNYTVVRAKDRECQRGILNGAEENDCSNQKDGPLDEYFYASDLHYLYQLL